MECMRHLGIDYGTKRVGTALSDEAGVMGFPYQVFPNDPSLIDQISSLIERERVEKVVIGESKDFSGAPNPVHEAALAFSEALVERTNVPVVFEPEMLTTQEARRDFEGQRTNQGVVDASAAALILTSYLSRT